MVVANSISGENFIALLEARLERVHTEEQKKFIQSMDAPMICFASPGTGKTTTAISGLLYTELYNHVPGQNIYALSFTTKATAELSVRHQKTCEKLGLHTQTVTFRTLHSLCAQILRENYHLLGMDRLDTSESLAMARAVDLICEKARSMDKPLTNQTARNVVRAVRELNSSFIFDEDYVKTKKVFKDTRIDYDLFNTLRKYLYKYCTFTQIIPVDSIILYALQLLTEHPEVSKAVKEKCKVMLVDEAQDLSLLHLRVISLMTDCPILIGDMKQQIYAFNGACQEIVEQFYRLYPNSQTLYLNKSFRCADEIIEYANKIIEPNGFGSADITGVGPGGSVQLLSGLSLEDLAKQYHEDYYVTNNHLFTRDTMFLFRNNASAVPIAEALFNERVPMRLSKFQSAAELPVIRELVEILNLCRNPYNANYVGALAYLIPELRTFKLVQESPFYKHLQSSGSISVFEVNYLFKDIGTGSEAMTLLAEVSEKIKAGATMKTLLNMIYPMYYEQWLHAREWMLEYPSKYYTGLVQSIMRNKTFDKFIADESAKKQFVQECNEKNIGIRCYTMHASKGLEADDVYILDADEGIIPNLNKLEQLVKANCSMDAAREIRNERSLCYVAITRAKQNTYIVHSGSPASIIVGENPFTDFDDIYKAYGLTSDDINSFNDFLREET